MKRIATLCLLIFIYTKSAHAEYFAHGDVYGYTYDIIGEVMPHFGKISAQKIYAIKHKDGKIYNKIKRLYQESEIELTPQNECVYRPDHDHPTYLGRKSDGNYEELNVIYIKFECAKH